MCQMSDTMFLGRVFDYQGSEWSLWFRGFWMDWVVKRNLYEMSVKEGSL